jgi:glycosyltransferase involved in cell wall biosynthesis
MTTITFIAIVKNESKIIKRCLDSLKTIIDYIVISDTGSTDNTIEIIDEFMIENKIDGKIFKDEWKNFGVNRSLSVSNAQQWLDQMQINRENNFLLTIDADMVLKIEPEFHKDMLRTCSQWNIRQINSSLTYYNTRIMRSDLPFKCIGVTHEHWGCDVKTNTGKMEYLYINDVGDGGSKADKYSRDIKLLTQGLIDEPKNERYLFYLAQSYECIGEREKAIEYFEKRIKAGGWNEEVFIAHNRVGDLYYATNQQEKAFCAWLNGYDYLPQRAETLYKIISKSRISGKNKSAVLFLTTALKIPYPKSMVLFVEHHVYNYKLLEELSIVGYYANKVFLSLLATQYIELSKNVPVDGKSQTRSNSLFYFNKMAWKNHINFVVPPSLTINQLNVYLPSSSCLYPLSSGVNDFEGVVRAVNYSITNEFKYIIRDPQNVVRTKNYWVKKVNGYTDYSEIICTAAPKRVSHISGLEDLRIVTINDKIYGLAVDWEYGEFNHPSVVVAHLMKENDKINIKKIVHTNYKNNICQKNWVPFTENGKLLAIYSHHPLTILEINPETGHTTVQLIKELSIDSRNFRGSSIPFRLDDGSYLMVIHEVIQKDTRKYFHRILKYSKNWDLLEVSVPFFFQNLFVEFTLSLYVVGNLLTIPFSTKDNTFEMVNIELNNIQWLPQQDRNQQFDCEYIKKWISDNI